ncbi:hypothetical protein E8E12_009765 [Didymella heteroderae]|uniref:Uncharacterized protein n=1 Tax=Didymella heteroderae TaxID=1769908 RepID=A0A9P5C598_9PLEO|nr:hypothetical protein E8E12_009765 [Didymella heteroderae]
MLEHTPVMLDPATLSIVEDFSLRYPKQEYRQWAVNLLLRIWTLLLDMICGLRIQKTFAPGATTADKDRWDNIVEDYHAAEHLYNDNYPKKPHQNMEASIEQFQREKTEHPRYILVSPPQEWNEDVSGKLISYARTYIFADKYLISALQRDLEHELR